MVCNFRDKKIESDRSRLEAATLADSIAAQAGRAVGWATPRVNRAREEFIRAAREAQVRAQPVVEQARTRVVEEYVPAAQRAAEGARIRVVEEYVPAAQRAAIAAQEAVNTEGTLTERAQRAALAAKQAALTPEVPVKKKHPVLKTFCWLTVAGCAAGAAYVIWRRSQPVEDPWAEEYWADSTDEPAAEEPVAPEAAAEAAPEESAAD
ncbi:MULTISPECIES: hypothetical protein [unclassified Actinomyces]|uniref:hypothetical protein n=1 Tax=unclassified Actinomyces TaxID=2609248 RepID=UPI001373F6CB|nr:MULTISPECIES: hypothetical protein [unclassified Actinomyces]MBW3069811.1 hypothetical protein [Actinomyces sp. 594]NDR54152.1 hypothetical protein [Actinomyces sp. 565]QHO90052.1 hypothetical protein CWT12_00065 [Actinomyces sp. 432]